VGLAAASTLVVFGFIHFRDGLANDAAIPVPVSMVAHSKLPKAAYRAAADALANANSRDGEAMIYRAEAELRAGANTADVISLVRRGLTLAPASARGWTLLSEALMVSDKDGASRALSQALILAPEDYFLIGAHLSEAAQLWGELDQDTRRLALAQMRLMWQETKLREFFFDFAQTRENQVLIRQAFENEEIRDINRWLMRESRQRERANAR
jgi:hypothetical protein